MSLLNRLKKRFFSRKLSLQERFPNFRIGRASYGNPIIRSWNEGASLEIGAFCSIAAGVKIFLGGEHRSDWVSTFPFTILWKQNAGHIPGHPRTRGNVLIGNDVWIGTEALILSGVKIGDGAVVGARAVVTRDVPPYSIVAGNPARIVRLRFDEQTITRLLKLSWWHWKDEDIQEYLPLILNTRVELFLDTAEADPRFNVGPSNQIC